MTVNEAIGALKKFKKEHKNGGDLPVILENYSWVDGFIDFKLCHNIAVSKHIAAKEDANAGEVIGLILSSYDYN